MSQNELIEDYLDKHEGITQKIATERFGIMRLASRISDLKRKGVNISKVMIQVPTRSGKPAWVARYRKIKEGSNE